ncbi:hypothetical protein DL96DRAFT_1578053 [Flagelloscypha sp. PMI_526]|nr:hypothetical protein DL96DRAFT_1578053 [Flagelloscypha sp. PMI_526]
MSWPSTGVVNPFALSAATLVSDSPSSRFKWATLIDPSSPGPTTLNTLTTCLSPPLRHPSPTRKIPHVSAQRVSEHGTAFIRSHFPDVDIPAELVRDQLLLELEDESSRANFDPSLGERLALIQEEDDFVHNRGHELTLARVDLSSQQNTQVRLAGRMPADIHARDGGSALVVNQVGQVFQIDLTSASSSPRQISPANEDQLSGSFFRLLSLDLNTCLRMSSSSLDLLDVRLPSMTRVFDSSQSSFCTCISKAALDQCCVLTTTREMLWFDQRKWTQPLVALPHMRSHDRTLRTFIIKVAGTYYDSLCSGSGGFLSLYDVRRNNDLVQVKPPIAISVDTGDLVGQTITSSPTSHSSLLSLDPTGSLKQTVISSEPFDGISRPSTNSISQSEPRSSLLSKQDFVIVDFSGIYKTLFLKPDVEHDTDAVHEVVNELKSFWKNYDHIEEVLTLFDVAHVLHEQQTSSTRSRFLAQTPLESSRGYMALQRGHLDFSLIESSAMWKHNLFPTLKALDPDLKDTPHEILESLQPYKLSKVATDRSPESLRQEAESLQKLTLNLFLSSNTVAASLNPRDVSALDDDHAQIVDKGVASLLDDWHVGSPINPPRSIENVEHTHGGRDFAENQPIAFTSSQVHAPPLVMASQTVQDVPNHPWKPARGLPALNTDYGVSQSGVPSTQIEPGRYGGRPGVKPKVKKKRMGGF